MIPTPVTEPEIRALLLSELEARDLAGGTVREEFPVERGSARIDVAVIGMTLDGYEIKSDLDTFTRFSNQIHAYNRVFDSISLVCGNTHSEHAMAVLPSWWGIIEALRDNSGRIQLHTLRAARTNTRQEAFSLASLLWRDEALAVLASENQSTPKKASSHVLWEQIASSLSMSSVKQAVVGSLVRRMLQSSPAVRTM